MYFHRTSRGPVDLAFTDRYGGVSAAPFDSLDLALVGADDPADVAENHQLVLGDFAPGSRVADMLQVHGADAVLVDGPAPLGPDGHVGQDRPRCDALVTTQPEVVLMVRAADCVPLLLADSDRGVVAVAHAGRPGLAKGVVPAVLRLMREQGAEEITAWLGPHVCGLCYEVPEAMQQEVVAAEPASASTTSWGTPALDIGAGVRAQLDHAGVAVVDVSRCTRESADLYSHRRDGDRAGRLAGLITRRSR